MKADPWLSPWLRISTRFLWSLSKRCRTCNYLENGNSRLDAPSHSGNAGEFWRTWALDPKLKWEHSRAQSQRLARLRGEQRCWSVTTAAIRHFLATSNIPQYLHSWDWKCKEKTFSLLLSFWTENIFKLKKDQEVFICINMYPSLSDLPRSTNFLNSKNQSAISCNRNQLKASVLLFEHSRLHGKDPVKMIYPWLSFWRLCTYRSMALFFLSYTFGAFLLSCILQITKTPRLRNRLLYMSR